MIPDISVKEMKVDTTLVEGIAGTWYYHLAKDGRSLCGAKTMPTRISVVTWGLKTHINERYCSKCKELSDEKDWIMKSDKTAKRVIPGHEESRFTKDEVKTAMFEIAYHRKPTEEELKRIMLTTSDRNSTSWNLTLTFTEKGES